MTRLYYNVAQQHEHMQPEPVLAKTYVYIRVVESSCLLMIYIVLCPHLRPRQLCVGVCVCPRVHNMYVWPVCVCMFC
jgi:hypothetical protein